MTKELNFWRTGITLLGGFLVLMGIIVLVLSITTIQPYEVGIVLRMGKIIDTWEEGMHFRIPLIDNIITYDLRTIKIQDSTSTASQDMQEVTTTIAVSFHIIQENVNEIYRNLGTVEIFTDTILSPAIHEATKTATAMFTAEELLSNRISVKEEIYIILQPMMEGYNIELDEVSVINFQFSAEFDKAIESKVVAQQQVEQALANLERIQIEAQQQIAEAEGIAQARILEAEAEAEALRLQKEQITDELLQLRWIEKWNGILPVYSLGGENFIIDLGN